MISKIKKPVSMLLALMMVVSLFAIVPITASAAEETSTVTWGNNNLNNGGTGGMSSGGVTLTTQQAKTRVGDCFYSGRGSATFTAPEGSVFTKIEFKNCSDVNSLNLPGASTAQSGGYWQQDPWDDDPHWIPYYTVTWTGELSEVTFSGAIYGIQSIVFTLKSVAPTTYTVTWKNYDDTVIGTSTVAEDETPIFSDEIGEIKEKPADAQYTYTFAGWTPEVVPVTGDATYTATFDANVNEYTITWKNDDGSVIDTTTVAYGEVPTHADPTKEATAQYTYTFTGWDTEPVAVTGDAEYTATFSSTVNEYTITWKNWDGSVLETDEDVEAGATPTYDGEDPVKLQDDEYVYEFAGWDPEVSAVSGDVEYTAQFTEGVKEIINGKYYVDGILTKGAGLVKYQGDYYYVKVTGALYKDASLVVSEAKSNGLLPASNYTFDEDGKLQLRNGVVHGKYYVDGVLTKGVGAVEFNGDIYFVKQNGSVLTDSVIVVPAAKANDLVTPGSHRFGADGKFVH